MQFAALAAKSLMSTMMRRWRQGPRRPSWSFRFEFAVELMRQAWMLMKEEELIRVRAGFASMPRPNHPLRTVTQTPWRAEGVSGVMFEPPVGKRDKESLILYLHGGAYVLGSSQTHSDLMARLCIAAGMRCLCIDYRLAPEHPYPAQLEDAKAAYRALLASGEQASRIAVAGESAGGNLALALCLALRDAGEPLPATAALISPWVELEALSESIQRNADYDFGERTFLLRCAAAFAGELPLGDPRISPLHATLAGLPPLHIQYGEAELLADECLELARRAKDQGVDVDLDALPDMPHAALSFAAFSPLAQDAVVRVANYLRKRLD